MMKRSLVFYIVFLSVLLFLGCSTERNFQFAWLSDTHVNGSTSVDDLRLVVRDINSMEEIDFTVITGDITEKGSNAELELAKTILDSLKKPYHIIPGNHDTKWSESGCTKFSELWGSDKFNFEYGGIRFIGMHQGPLMRMGDGFFSPEDVRWLDKQLNKISTKQPLFFMTHYPLDSSISNWYEVLDRLKKYNTRMVFLGHGHRNKVMDFEGVPGVMGRSTLRRNQKSGGYNIVRMRQDSVLIFERITADETKDAWLKFALTEKDNAMDTTKYERPDFSGNDLFPNISAKWIFETNYTIASAPAVWENFVISGNSNGDVFCLSLENGEKIWTFETGKSVFSSPAVSEGKVVFASADSKIYCLNIKSGALLWEYETEAPVVAVPAVHENIVYIGSSDHRFRAINLENGELVWEYSGVGGFVETKALIHRGKIIFGAWDGYLYALNQKDGTLCWKWSNGKEWDLLSPAACYPAASGDKVFIVAPDRYETAIDVETGKTIWRTNRFKVRESMGISEDGKTVFAKCMRDTVIAYSALSENPDLIWKTFGGFGYDINPCVIIEKNGTVFFGTQRGFVFAVDSHTGKVKWNYRVGVSLVNAVLPVSEDKLLLTDMNGRVILLETK